MRVYALSMDRNLIAIGFRRVVAVGRQAGFDIQSIYFLDDIYSASLAGSWWKQRMGDGFAVNEAANKDAVIKLAGILSDADAIAFSLMSPQREVCRLLCGEIKKRNAKVKIIIGGYHATAFPDDAISFADVICRGEGENTFVDFLRRVEKGESLRGLKNTWIKENGQILKNPRAPLLTPGEMENMPFMEYTVENQFLFSCMHGILKPMEKKDFVRHLGTTYNTIWSVGCPYFCSFCTNAKAIELDRGYARARGASADYVIREIKNAMQAFPIDYIIFNDSDFLARSIDDLREFGSRFKKEIGLKIKTNGLNPVSVTEEKLKIMIDAGLVRTMMGFESGSQRTLKLYNRPGGQEALRRAAEVFSKFKGKMCAPCFEIITDNPFETNEDLYETIHFLDSIPGPFTISLFGLCLMPGTSLAEMVKDSTLLQQHVDKEYLYSYSPTPLNLLISLFAVFKPPHRLVRWLKKIIWGKEKKTYPHLKSLLYKLMLIRRALDQTRFGDFGTFPSWVMMLYHRVRTGPIVKFFEKSFSRSCRH